MIPSLILINPWIYDFAAYDLWSKPLGLLHVAAYLRGLGFDVHLIDCLDVHHPGMKGAPFPMAPKRRSYGTGKFFREPVPKPPPLQGVPKTYSRYGITPDLFLKDLAGISKPAAILVTSLMTYWYPGVKEAIRIAREAHPGVPVFLGGIYARLCPAHAEKQAGADRVLTAAGPDPLIEVLKACGISPPCRSARPPVHRYPAFDLLRRIDYVCILTSVGCPYRCTYCASRFLNPVPMRRPPEDVLEEIFYWHRCFGVRDFAFYDDALLSKHKGGVTPVLEALAEHVPGLRFHTPNALHVKEITADTARLLRRAGFRTLRLGLETADPFLHRYLDNKVSLGDFERAVGHLLSAGYPGRDIGAYILMGIPGHPAGSVLETIEYVEKAGAVPYLSEYSPIPHTALWEKALRHSLYDLASEPLFHNNTLLPCWDDAQKKQLPQLKKRVLEIRRKFRQEAV